MPYRRCDCFCGDIGCGGADKHRQTNSTTDDYDDEREWASMGERERERDAVDCSSSSSKGQHCHHSRAVCVHVHVSDYQRQRRQQQHQQRRFACGSNWQLRTLLITIQSGSMGAGVPVVWCCCRWGLCRRWRLSITVNICRIIQMWYPELELILIQDAVLTDSNYGFQCCCCKKKREKVVVVKQWYPMQLTVHRSANIARWECSAAASAADAAH